LKQNSLFGTDRVQQLEDIGSFCEKIQAGRAARRSEDFMVIARIEALISGAGMEEALKRAAAYTSAGADGIMIHSRQKSPGEILQFIESYRAAHGDQAAPIIAVPSSYNSIYESELDKAGVAIIIYANHLLRAAYPAMLSVAESILAHGRSKEVDSTVMGIKEVLTIIDEDPSAPKGERFTASGSTAAKPTAPAALAEPAAPSVTKLDPLAVVAYLREELGVDFYGGVPDSCIAPFCAALNLPSATPSATPSAGPGDLNDLNDLNDVSGVAKMTHVIAANEGAAVGMAVGHHLATGRVPLVYMQNSGLTNAANPLMSAAHPEVYGCPMVLFIGWRGAPGVHDEPQHVVQGRKTVEMLASMDVTAHILPTDMDGARDTFAKAVRAAAAGSRPVAILAPPGSFQVIKPSADMSSSHAMDLTAADETKRPTRESAIAAVAAAMRPDDAVVATTGYASRELYELREQQRSDLRTLLPGAARDPHASDFLTVGSMGHAISIAQGIALAQPHRTVWCIDGDGASLMHLGSMAASAPLGLSGLRHVLLNNGRHDSVGGQPTVGTQLKPARGVKQQATNVDLGSTNSTGDNYTGDVHVYDHGAPNFSAVASALGYSTVATANTSQALALALSSMSADDAPSVTGPRFLEVKLRSGTRGDLGRPKMSPADTKASFMKHLAN